MGRSKAGEAGRCLIVDGLGSETKNLDLVLEQRGIMKKFQQWNYCTLPFQQQHSGGLGRRAQEERQQSRRGRFLTNASPLLPVRTSAVLSMSPHARGYPSPVPGRGFNWWTATTHGSLLLASDGFRLRCGIRCC